MGSAVDYRPDIDGLRAVAVMSVVLFHAGYAAFAGGFAGVDIFFVISGFLITRLIRRDVEIGQFGFGRFYLRRARRLFPAMFVAVVLTFGASALVLSPDLFKDFSASAIAALTSVSNIYFWMSSGYFDSDAILKPLLHTWSLGVEEQFYLVWPLPLVAVLRFSDRAALCLLGLLGVASLVAAFAFSAHQSAVFYLMPFRIFELATGGVLVWLVDREIPIPKIVREIVLLIGIGLVAVAVFGLDGTVPFPLVGLIPTLGAAFCIWSGTARFFGYVLRNPLSVYVGRISYSTYLVHWPVVVLYRYLIDRDLVNNERLAMVAAALAGGAIMYWLVEQRFRRSDRPNSWRPFGFAAGCVGAAAAGVAVAGPAYVSDGWTWRLGDRQSLYIAATSQAMGEYGGKDCAQVRCANEGKTGRPLYVIGDSHARAYFTGINAVFPDRPSIFFESNACLFFSSGYMQEWLSHNAASTACVAARKQAFDELRGQKDYDLIVSQSWQPFDMIDLETGEVIKFPTDDDFARFVVAELSKLKADLAPTSLTIIGNVPTTGSLVGPLHCLGRPFGSLIDCEPGPINEPIAARKSTNDALRTASKDIAQFRDPFDALCHNSRCTTFTDGKVLYSDWNHLSGWGSELVVGILFKDGLTNTTTPR